MFLCLALLLPLLVSSAPAPAYVKVLPLDCDEIYRSGVQTSGVYTIYPTGDSPVEVYCEMYNNNEQAGGWTVFQRRMDGSVNFYRQWDAYRRGFGNKSGEYWLGLENLYQMTRKNNYQLRVDLEDFEGFKAYAVYNTFSVGDEASSYVLNIGRFIDGGAGDSLIYHNGRPFSTSNRDQDASSINCAANYLGGFWYGDGYMANPNGIYLGGRDPTLYAIGNTWATWRGLDGLKYICMKFRITP